MKSRHRIKTFTAILWALIILSLLLCIKTSEDPVPNVFKSTWIEPWFQNFPAGNAIIFNMSIGFLVSSFFYFLVVWFPERRRKNIIKNNLVEQYQSFKEDTISILLSACQSSYKGELPKDLSNQSEFRVFFEESVSDSQNRWHVVLNNLNDRLLQELLVEFEILLNEVTYVLNNVTFEDPNVFSFFKRLSQTVYKMKNTTLDYDDVKHLSGFLWELFAGWSFIDGYRDDDIVSVMIKEI